MILQARNPTKMSAQPSELESIVSESMISTISMSEEITEESGRLTPADLRAQRFWNIAPWLALSVITIIPPLALGLLALLLGGAAVYWLLTLAAIPFSMLIAVTVTIVMLLMRRNWKQRVRERLASDGITADEIDWFRAELTRNEKRALDSMDHQQPLLADAYRETLALRLNAARLTANARRQLLVVERRINRARYLNAPDTAVLMEELNRDRTRLTQLKQEGSARRTEAEARLQMIEAAASRGASWAETNYMLQRLEEGRKQLPLGLENERARQQFREESEQLRKELTQ